MGPAAMPNVTRSPIRTGCRDMNNNAAECARFPSRHRGCGFVGSWCRGALEGHKTVSLSRTVHLYRAAMLWRVRNSRGRPKNVPAGFIHPCRPTIAKQPPRGEGWVHELKHDGYRLQFIR